MSFFLGKETRFVVPAFSLIFMLIGSALITIGVVYRNTTSDLSKIIPETYRLHIIPTFSIIVGVSILVLAFAGLAVICITNSLLLTVYAILLLIIFSLQFTLGIFILCEVSNKDDLSSNLNATMDQVFRNLDEGPFVNYVQKELLCCGTDKSSFWSQEMNKPFPETCCKDEACLDMHHKGCRDAVCDLLWKATRVVGFTVLAFSTSQIAGALLVFGWVYAIITSPKVKGYMQEHISLEESSSVDD